jgi:hypothetical protein
MRYALQKGMKNERCNVVQIPLRRRAKSSGATLVRSGEVVPRSGIYEKIHECRSPEEESFEVVVVRGECVQACRTCGGEVPLRLLYAAPHILEDGDFQAE